MTPLPDKRYYRPDEIAKELDVSVVTVYRWIGQDEIGHVHVGRHIRIPRAALDEFVRTHFQQAKA